MKASLERHMLWVCLALVLVLPRCGRPVEGCLDIRAVNFKADADRDCCCEWPTLNLTLSHRVGEGNHDPSALYANSLGQPWQMPAPVVLLSDFQLHFTGQPSLVLLDSMLLTAPDGQSDWWRRDQVVLDRDLSRITVGRFIGSGFLDSLTFRVGLLPGLEVLTPEQFPEGHPLRSDRFGLWEDGSGYAGVLARFIAPGSGQDTLVWRLKTPVVISIPIGQEIVTGRNAELALSMDYKQWFEEQDLSGPSPQPSPLWPFQIRASLK